MGTKILPRHDSFSPINQRFDHPTLLELASHIRWSPYPLLCHVTPIPNRTVWPLQGEGREQRYVRSRLQQPVWLCGLDSQHMRTEPLVHGQGRGENFTLTPGPLVSLGPVQTQELDSDILCASVGTQLPKLWGHMSQPLRTLSSSAGRLFGFSRD